MELRITTLIENQGDDKKSLLYEHGFSLYIEFDQKKFLFDTGQTGSFLENAKKLEISVKDIDFFIVSHGHYDHSSGVLDLMNLFKEKKKMYLGEGFFQEKYKILEDGTYKYNGNSYRESDLLKEKIQIERVTDDITYITDKILLFKNFHQTWELEHVNPKFYLKKGDTYIQDEFQDEISLGLLTKKGLVLIVGCSHPGIVNIIRNVMDRIDIPLYGVIGGTHLIDADERRLEKTVDELKKYQVKRMAFSHCTGQRGMEKMEEAFKILFEKNHTGNIMEI
ncbi:MAG: MBL fold metallo-hydrolase [Anaerostipes sp.]|jgi:7,8-dihydropterin-6-yl-methyl-4-(beta-D-ribofuranosyl)aminobenzene 5'-phosphate synthase